MGGRPDPHRALGTGPWGQILKKRAGSSSLPALRLNNDIEPRSTPPLSGWGWWTEVGGRTCVTWQIRAGGRLLGRGGPSPCQALIVMRGLSLNVKPKVPRGVCASGQFSPAARACAGVLPRARARRGRGGSSTGSHGRARARAARACGRNWPVNGPLCRNWTARVRVARRRSPTRGLWARLAAVSLRFRTCPEGQRCAMTVTLPRPRAPVRGGRRRAAGPARFGAGLRRFIHAADRRRRRRGPPSGRPRRRALSDRSWRPLTCARKCRRRPYHRRCTC